MSQEQDLKSVEAKVVVLGSQGVGKTSVVIRYVGNMFSKHVSPTIGASFFTYKMIIDNFRCKLQVWDTAGQERFRSMAPMYYRKANAAMLVYDMTALDTFYDIKDWVKELKRNVDTPIVMCILGNKSDLEKERAVQIEDAQEYAQSIGAFFYETSALSNTGIEEAFLEVAKELIHMHKTMPNAGLLCPEESGNLSNISTDNGPMKLDNNPPKRNGDCSC